MAFGRRHDHCVAFQNIGLHALSMDAETNSRTALQQRVANRGELRGIPLLDGLRLPHGRWPPQRIRRGQIGKWNKELRGRRDPEIRA